MTLGAKERRRRTLDLLEDSLRPGPWLLTGLLVSHQNTASLPCTNSSHRLSMTLRSLAHHLGASLAQSRLYLQGIILSRSQFWRCNSSGISILVSSTVSAVRSQRCQLLQPCTTLLLEVLVMHHPAPLVTAMGPRSPWTSSALGLCLPNMELVHGFCTHQEDFPTYRKLTFLSRYYVLVATCVLLRKAEWLRNACLAAALLVPSIGALHGIVLAFFHVNGQFPPNPKTPYVLPRSI